MTDLIPRITAALENLDRDTAHPEQQMPTLLTIREHQRVLTNLLAEMATALSEAKKSELGTYVRRRRIQAEMFRKARMDDHMSAKDAEESSRLLIGEECDQEIQAAVYLTHLEVLHRALLEKVQFCKDWANDIKHLDRMETFGSAA